MMLIASNASDIQKYYESSYVKLRDFGDQVFLINKVTREGVYFSTAAGEEGIIYLEDSAPYNLDMVLPNKALFQLGNYCYSLARIPARQYHRGITPQNCQISRLEGEGWRKQSLSFTNLQGYMSKPTYRPFADVVATCKQSEALSDRFAYQASNKRLWCDSTIVGTVNPALKTVACNPLLVLEVSRIIGNSSTYKVIPV